MNKHTLFFLLLLPATVRGGESVMTPMEFLNQVRLQNVSFRAIEENGSGAVNRIREKELLTSPVAYANASTGQDGKPFSPPLFEYDRVDVGNYEIGIRRQNAYGTEASLSYALDYTRFRKPSIAGIPISYYDASPVLSVSQSLWKNRFGRTTRAQQELIAAQGAAERYDAEFKITGALVEAEVAYWRLSLAREAVRIQEEALRQARSILDYVTNREIRHLGDHGDVLQAQALVESRTLELKAAEDEESSAARRFNLIRNTPGTSVPEKLVAIDQRTTADIKPPAEVVARADVEAAKLRAESAAANAQILSSQNEPDLQLFGLYALNKRNSGLGEALGDSASSDSPTRLVGIKFSMPLAFDAVRDSRQGACQQSNAAALVYEQKEVDQGREWADLVERLRAAQERMGLAHTMEDIQKRKLEFEKRRLREGRTTTYQVLLFEQDHSQAQLACLKVAFEVLTLNAQTRLYTGLAGGVSQ